MSSHVIIADLRGANAGLRQKLAEHADLSARLEDDIINSTAREAVLRAALERIRSATRLGSVANGIALQALEDCYHGAP